MNRVLKFNTTERNVWFTSDFHFNHAKEFIWQKRGYGSIDEHNKHIIETLNFNVKADDDLFFLGDFCLNCSQEEFEMFLEQIVCKNIWTLFGNHNSRILTVYQQQLKALYGFDDLEVYPLRYKNLVFLGNYAEITVDGQFVVLSHYPLFSWNHLNKGSMMLHGHEHCAIDNHLPEGSNGKILDVGWDYYKKPLAFSEIQEIMKTKFVVNVGHH